MKELTLPDPDDLPEAVRYTPEEMAAQLRLMAALKMFEPDKLSSGKAAELAGLSRVEFLELCGRYRVSAFNYPPEEIAAVARHLGVRAIGTVGILVQAEQKGLIPGPSFAGSDTEPGLLALRCLAGYRRQAGRRAGGTGSIIVQKRRRMPSSEQASQPELLIQVKSKIAASLRSSQ
ncbi:MAG: UPF0175 family protein [Armatimonadetes bacterium]|nr:UPF0175 family protein [Armatimonadota bacterium]